MHKALRSVWGPTGSPADCLVARLVGDGYVGVGRAWSAEALDHCEGFRLGNLPSSSFPPAPPLTLLSPPTPISEGKLDGGMARGTRGELGLLCQWLP